MTVKRSNDRTLKEAIDQMLNTFHLKSKMNEVRLVSSWEKIMGKTVASRTTEIYIRNKKLFVFLNSASLREDLHHMRDKIISTLNEEIGSEVIDDIILQ